MSIEFFNQVEQIEKLAKSIKFLDGSHPVIGDKYTDRVEKIRSELVSLDADLRKDLAAFIKASTAAKKKRRAKPKTV